MTHVSGSRKRENRNSSKVCVSITKGCDLRSRNCTSLSGNDKIPGMTVTPCTFLITLLRYRSNLSCLSFFSIRFHDPYSRYVDAFTILSKAWSEITRSDCLQSKSMREKTNQIPEIRVGVFGSLCAAVLWIALTWFTHTLPASVPDPVSQQ